MAWRFKASKYKNAFPVAPKKEDLIQGLSLGSYRSHGNFIGKNEFLCPKNVGQVHAGYVYWSKKITASQIMILLFPTAISRNYCSMYAK